MRTEKWDANAYIRSDTYYRRKLELAIAEFQDMHPDIEIRKCDIQNVTRLHDVDMSFSVRLSLNLRDVFESKTSEDYDCVGSF